MDIKPIRTAADHAAALKEIERLRDKAQPGTPEGDQFEVLSTSVDAYERASTSRSRRQIPSAPSASAWNEEGLTPKDLIPIFKSRAHLGGHGQEAAAEPRDDPAPARRRGRACANAAISTRGRACYEQTLPPSPPPSSPPFWP
jgi:antitoxin component HigA of HigAB toxin-antitoxin module